MDVLDDDRQQCHEKEMVKCASRRKDRQLASWTRSSTIHTHTLSERKKTHTSFSVVRQTRKQLAVDTHARLGSTVPRDRLPAVQFPKLDRELEHGSDRKTGGGDFRSTHESNKLPDLNSRTKRIAEFLEKGDNGFRCSEMNEG